MLTNLLTFLCVSSISLNWYLYYLLRTSKKEPTADARELLHYLTTGGAVVQVTVKDPTKLLYYKG
jgi:hypothetical protein